MAIRLTRNQIEGIAIKAEHLDAERLEIREIDGHPDMRVEVTYVIGEDRYIQVIQ